MAALRYQLHHPSEKMGEATTSSRHHDSTLHLTHSLAPLYTYSNNTRRSHTPATDNTISQELDLVFGAGALHDIYPSQSPPGAKNKQRRKRGTAANQPLACLCSAHTHTHTNALSQQNTRKKGKRWYHKPRRHTTRTQRQTAIQSDSQTVSQKDRHKNLPLISATSQEPSSPSQPHHPTHPPPQP